MRRGHRYPVELSAGDALDFWRVEAWEDDRLLRLCAEMKLPGRACGSSSRWRPPRVAAGSPGGRSSTRSVWEGSSTGKGCTWSTG